MALYEPCVRTYVIGQPGLNTSGPVKIGSTSIHPHARMATLQTGNPSPLDVIRLYRGRDKERLYQDQFKAYALMGEWFEPCVIEWLDWPDEFICAVCKSILPAPAPSHFDDPDGYLRLFECWTCEACLKARSAA